MRLPSAEAGRVGALEAVDGLLDVAHGEDGADRPGIVARRGAARLPLDTTSSEEFLGQRGGDAPLRGVAVLRLVQQDMLQPAIELVEHPGAAGILQHPPR